MDISSVIDQVLLGDSAELLRELPDACVEAVVTDPPFGIGFLYNKPEDHSTPEEYWAWLAPIHEQIDRVLKPGGFLAIWQAQKNYRYLWTWFGADIHIYAACRNFTQLRRTPFNYAYDPVVMRYKGGGVPLRPADPPRNCDFYVGNTARYVSQTEAIAREHPCPRPLDAVEEILRNFALPGAIVLDPFLGSGTTAVACVNTGRRYIGIEKHSDYHGVALRRLRQTHSDFFAFGSE